MALMYELESEFVKRNYPIIHKVWGRVDKTEPSVNVGATPTASITGYEYFRQVGLQLKEKVSTSNQKHS